MKISEIFTPNGDGYDIAPAGILLLLADELYGKNKKSQSAKLKSELQKMIDDFIQAATAGGYKQADILRTLLVRNEQSSRVAQMAIDACSLAGDQALIEIARQFR